MVPTPSMTGGPMASALLVVLSVLVGLLVAIHAPSGVRAPVVFLFASFVPGWSLLRLFPLPSATLELVASLALSVSIYLLAAWIMVVAGLWYPYRLFNGVVAFSVICGLVALTDELGWRRRSRRRRALAAGRLGPPAPAGLGDDGADDDRGDAVPSS